MAMRTRADAERTLKQIWDAVVGKRVLEVHSVEGAGLLLVFEDATTLEIGYASSEGETLLNGKVIDTDWSWIEEPGELPNAQSTGILLHTRWAQAERRDTKLFAAILLGIYVVLFLAFWKSLKQR